MPKIFRLPLSLLMLAYSGAALRASPAAYDIDASRSSVQFATDGTPHRFDVSISNLIGNLQLAEAGATPVSLELAFDLASHTSGNSAIDEVFQGRSRQWVDRYPYGLTLATDIRAISPGSFLGDSTLALRDVSCVAPVTFNWRTATEGGRRVGYLHGTTQIDARDFGIRSEDPLDRVMTVTYDLRVTPAEGKVPSVARFRPDPTVVLEDYPPPRCSPSRGSLAPEALRTLRHPQF